MKRGVWVIPKHLAFTMRGVGFCSRRSRKASEPMYGEAAYLLIFVLLHRVLKFLCLVPLRLSS